MSRKSLSCLYDAMPGVVVIGGQISMEVDHYDLSSWSDDKKLYVPLTHNANATLNIIATSKYGIDNILQSCKVGNGGHHLGPGSRCSYCNTVWLPGTFRCVSCGAETEYSNRVMGWNRNGIITYTSVSFFFADIIKVNVRVEYIEVPEFAYPFTLKDLGKMILFGKPDEWVCPYCGCYILGARSKCPGCGGNKLPISEIDKMDRMCVYCGKKTRGGYACKKCNGKLQRCWN